MTPILKAENRNKYQNKCQERSLKLHELYQRTVGQNWVFGKKPSYITQYSFVLSINVINALLYY